MLTFPITPQSSPTRKCSASSPQSHRSRLSAWRSGSEGDAAGQPHENLRRGLSLPVPSSACWVPMRGSRSPLPGTPGPHATLRGSLCTPVNARPHAPVQAMGTGAWAECPGPPQSSCSLLVSLGTSLGTWMPRGPSGECVCLQVSLVPGGCLGAAHQSQGPLETQREGCQGSELLWEMLRSEGLGAGQGLLREVAGWRQPPRVGPANAPGATSSALCGTRAPGCVPAVCMSRRVQACVCGRPRWAGYTCLPSPRFWCHGVPRSCWAPHQGLRWTENQHASLGRALPLVFRDVGVQCQPGCWHTGGWGALRGLAHTDVDLDSDSGPWPRADEEAAPRPCGQQLGCSGPRAALFLFPSRRELTR